METYLQYKTRGLTSDPQRDWDHDITFPLPGPPDRSCDFSINPSYR